ncbi:hypothetical protein C351_02380 [Cryptococcus neoformans c8]|nr:hypothetical protein C353_02658 [Cryptococcus neoformans var. grubii AD1-83a]OXG61620.1 hypothetical protein C354_02595 [Cryptococcus neoformans var. grubii MW-RSA1955]OXG65192.1 hypothetical protein C351_02380 [Cryptococcus neoformans var. grubii c8]OXG66750.1 hypothetical protein C352_02604 [Cryptococcus neoformans var. grubii CHC193]OXH12924.1 hypothetical protein C369_02637 [Cryptococcus neoformans var. grubii A5-35-17]OXH13850.1 hypothetical protein C370_02648 [Cryptococcus neoformans 
MTDRSKTLPGLAVENSVAGSKKAWIRDLFELYEHAEGLYPDMRWRVQKERFAVWGHKAIVYARASKAFRDAFLHLRSFGPTAGAPSPLLSCTRDPDLSIHRPLQLLPNSLDNSIDLTLCNNDFIFDMIIHDSAELLQTHLKMIYTSEGAEVLSSWVKGQAQTGAWQSELWLYPDGSETVSERRDKLSQDLTYMWRSKLFADVRIHLPSNTASGTSLEDLNATADPSKQTMIFTSHKFILACRSRYFSSFFKQHPHPQMSVIDIFFSSPQFTPAALHFCLGYIYAGTLYFSNRAFGLLTALQIHSCARYLQLEELVVEIESRIIHDLCHGLDWDHCHCKKCVNRAIKLWCSLAGEQSRPQALWSLTTNFIQRGWAGCWGRDVATSNAEEVGKLTRNIIEGIEPSNVIYTFYSLHHMRMKLEAEKRTAPEEAQSSGWLNRLQQMVDAVHTQACEIIISSIEDVAASDGMRTLMQDQDPVSLKILRIILHKAAERTNSRKTLIETDRALSLIASFSSGIDPSMRDRSSTSLKLSAIDEILKGIILQGVSNRVKSPDGELLEDKISSAPSSLESFLSNSCSGLKADNHRVGMSDKNQLCNSGTSAYASGLLDAEKEVKEIPYKLPSSATPLNFARYGKAYATSSQPSRSSWRPLLDHQPLLQKAIIQSCSSLDIEENQTNKYRQASNMTETSKFGIELFVGVPCVIFSHEKKVRFRASVRYIGYIQGLHGTWVGVEVDNLDRFGIDTLPSAVVSGVQYFMASAPSNLALNGMNSGDRNNPETYHQCGKTGGNRCSVCKYTGRKNSRSLERATPGLRRALFVRPSEVVLILGTDT